MTGSPERRPGACIAGDGHMFLKDLDWTGKEES